MFFFLKFYYIVDFGTDPWDLNDHKIYLDRTVNTIINIIIATVCIFDIQEMGLNKYSFTENEYAKLQ